MARSIEILLRERESSPTRCGYCHDGFEDEAVTRCLGCSAPHHLDCWVEHSACAACGHATPDREAEVRQLFRKVRQDRLNRLRERYQQQRGGFSSSRWISLIFIVEVLLALAVIVFGLLKDKSWVIVAYLAQGIALAIYFAMSDRQPTNRPNRHSQDPPTEAPPPRPQQPERISEQIRIRRVSPEIREDLIDTARLNAGEALRPLPNAFGPLPAAFSPPPESVTPTPTLVDRQSWPESAFYDHASPSWLADPQSPSASLFSNLNAFPPPPPVPPPVPPTGSAPSQSFFPFHDNLDSEGEFIQRVSSTREEAEEDVESDEILAPTPLEILANPRLFEEVDPNDEFEAEDVVEERFPPPPLDDEISS